MTEAEALAIAVKAIVSAFVTPAPVAEAPPSRPRKTRAAAPTRVDEPLPFNAEVPVGDFEPPEVTTAELDAMIQAMNERTPPPGMYDKNDTDRDLPGWLS